MGGAVGEKPESGEGTSCRNIWGKSNRGRKMNKDEGPEMVTCWHVSGTKEGPVCDSSRVSKLDQ